MLRRKRVGERVNLYCGLVEGKERGDVLSSESLHDGQLFVVSV